MPPDFPGIWLSAGVCSFSPATLRLSRQLRQKALRCAAAKPVAAGRLASRGEAAAFENPGLAQQGQAFQQGLDRGLAATVEMAGDFAGAGFAQGLQGGADGGNLFGPTVRGKTCLLSCQ